MDNTNIDATAAFKERITQKIATDIQNLLPDEVIKELVSKALEKQFFEPRLIDTGGYNGKKELPSWFVEEVTRLGEPIVRDYIKDWVKLNETVLRDGIKKFLAEQNLLLMVMEQSKMSTQQQLSEAIQHLASRLVAR